MSSYQDPSHWQTIVTKYKTNRKHLPPGPALTFALPFWIRHESFEADVSPFDENLTEAEVDSWVYRHLRFNVQKVVTVFWVRDNLAIPNPTPTARSRS